MHLINLPPEIIDIILLYLPITDISRLYVCCKYFINIIDITNIIMNRIKKINYDKYDEEYDGYYEYGSCRVVDDIKHGPCKIYRGMTKTICNYKHGYLCGKYTKYHENGSIAIIINIPDW